jgi:hypothetical protein
MRADELFYGAAERRIEYFAVGLGVAATAFAAPVWGARAAVGVGAGALLSWLNFRWLKQGVGALVTLSTAQAGAEKVRVPKRVYWKFLGRYALVIVVAYVILRRSSVPALALLSGLFAIVAAVLMELLYELSRGWHGSQES